ncbi:MAG: hypothetical protein ACTSXH_02830 [Promethearchaeota archaeon]
MELGNYTLIELLNGCFSFIFVIFSLIIGFMMFYKYFKFKHDVLITTGLCWTFMITAWFRISFNFPLVLLFHVEIPYSVGRVIDSIFIPIAIICWVYTFSTLIYPNHQKILVLIYIIISIIYEIITIYLLFVDPQSVVIIVSTFDSTYGLIPLIYSVFIIITFLITGALFALQSQKSDDPKIRLKGQFLFIAFILFSTASLLDAVLITSILALIIIRITLILSSLIYYLGFHLPEK